MDIESATPPTSHAFDLTGRTALVTGSARGLGKALATGLVGAGATVLVHGRDLGRARASADEIARSGSGTAVGVAFDVTDPRAVDEGIASIEESWRTPDILVNNAGIQRRGRVTEFSDEDWDQLLQTNLSSAFYLSRRVARGMVVRGSGKIIQIGSVQSLLARPSIAAYSATKGAIAMFTKGLCADLAPHGIQANAIAPGYFETDLTAELVRDPAFSAWVRSRTPAGRWGRPEDLVGAVLFLAGDASEFVNGQTLYVDGGMTAVI